MPIENAGLGVLAKKAILIMNALPPWIQIIMTVGAAVATAAAWSAKTEERVTGLEKAQEKYEERTDSRIDRLAQSTERLSLEMRDVVVELRQFNKAIREE